jgi:hypothetical protein
VVSTLEQWRAPLVVGDAVYLAEEMVASAVRTTGISDPTVNWLALTSLELLSVRLVGLRRTIGIEVWDAYPHPAEPLSPDNVPDSRCSKPQGDRHTIGRYPIWTRKVV